MQRIATPAPTAPTQARRLPSATREPRIHSRACTIPNGAKGSVHLAIHHPASGTLTYSGPATGAGWTLACQLAKMLGAKPRSIPLPAQVDIIDRAMLYDEARDDTLYAGLHGEQLEMFWSQVAILRQAAARAVA